MTSDSIIDGLKTLISLSTPFLLLFLGWWYTSHNKQAEEHKNNERKLAEMERQKITDSMTNATSALTAAQSDITTLYSTIDKVVDSNEKLSQTMEYITNNIQVNGRYTNELAQLVVALSEGIRDQHLDGNITKAVDTYRAFEAEMRTNLLTGDPKDPIMK